MLEAIPQSTEPAAARARAAGRRPARSPERPAPLAPDAEPALIRLLGALDERGVAVEELAQRLGWDLSRTLAELLPLEWSGVVERRPGARWARRASVPA